MERRFGSERELEPYVNTATSLLIGGLLVLLAYIVTAAAGGAEPAAHARGHAAGHRAWSS